MTFLTLRDGHLRINVAQITSIECNVITMSSRATHALGERDMQVVLKAIEGSRSSVPPGITLEDGLPAAELMTGKQRTKAGK